MAITYIYGPQAFTAGTFAKPTFYKSTDVGGPDAPITGYPEVVVCENVKTTAAGGPAGENILDIDESVDPNGAGNGSCYLSNVVGDLTGANQFGVAGVFDAGWLLDGVYVEWDQDLSTAYMNEYNYAMLLQIANGIGGILSPCIEIELQETTHPNYDIWFGWLGPDGIGGWTMTQASGHRPNVESITVDNAWHRFKAYFKAATVTGSYTSTPTVGSATIGSDGALKLWMDGTLIADLTGLQFTPNPYMTYSGQSQSPYAVSALNFGVSLAGPITNVAIYRDSWTIPLDESTPCCGDRATPGATDGGSSSTGSALGQNPYEALPAWTPACAGGGIVPTAADETDSESWAV